MKEKQNNTALTIWSIFIWKKNLFSDFLKFYNFISKFSASFFMRRGLSKKLDFLLVICIDDLWLNRTKWANVQ